MCDLGEPGAKEQCVSSSIAGRKFLSVLCGVVEQPLLPLGNTPTRHGQPQH